MLGINMVVSKVVLETTTVFESTVDSDMDVLADIVEITGVE